MSGFFNRIRAGSGPRISSVAKTEEIEPEILSANLLDRSAVLMIRGDREVAIGRNLRTKVNANIGTSPGEIDPGKEIEKARIAESAGADTISDLSTGGDIREIRRMIAAATTLPLTTVPIYQAAAECGAGAYDEHQLLDIMTEQAREGISSFVIHATGRKTFRQASIDPRVMRIVSKGGSLAISFMIRTGQENPYLRILDDILALMERHDIVLSLGNTMRSGCIADDWDRAHAAELAENYALAEQAAEAGVQVIIEGAGGHIRLDRIGDWIARYKQAGPYPVFVAGPLPTDIAVGHDHIAATAGASVAAGAGADYLCYITPAEHLALPTPGDVREGVISCRIAAHIGDSVKMQQAMNRDRALAEGRAAMNWICQKEHAIDPDGPVRNTPETGPCTMCGDFCAVEMMRRYLP